MWTSVHPDNTWQPKPDDGFALWNHFTACPLRSAPAKIHRLHCAVECWRQLKANVCTITQSYHFLGYSQDTNDRFSLILVTLPWVSQKWKRARAGVHTRSDLNGNLSSLLWFRSAEATQTHPVYHRGETFTTIKACILYPETVGVLIRCKIFTYESNNM